MNKKSIFLILFLLFTFTTSFLMKCENTKTVYLFSASTTYSNEYGIITESSTTFISCDKENGYGLLENFSFVSSYDFSVLGTSVIEMSSSTICHCENDGSSNVGDWDLFKFNTGANTNIGIRVYWVSDGGLTALTLNVYDSNFNQIAEGRRVQYITVADPIILTSNTDYYFAVQGSRCPNNVPYVVRITPLDSIACDKENGWLSLDFTASTPIDLGVLNNNSITSTSTMCLCSYNGNMPNRDIDFFKITSGTDVTKLFVEVSFTNDWSTNLSLAILDINFSQVANESTNWGNGPVTLGDITISPSSVYYAVVMGRSCNPNTPYTIRVNSVCDGTNGFAPYTNAINAMTNADSIGTLNASSTITVTNGVMCWCAHTYDYSSMQTDWPTWKEDQLPWMGDIDVFSFVAGSNTHYVNISLSWTGTGDLDLIVGNSDFSTNQISFYGISSEAVNSFPITAGSTYKIGILGFSCDDGMKYQLNIVSY